MAVRLCACLAAVAAAAAVGAAAPDVSRHSVVWTDLLAEPGQTDVVNERTYATYHNAMPVGNGHITAMIDYESANNTIVVLVSAASSWLENGETAKVGLLHVALPSRGGAPIGAGYRQTFNPQDATVRFSIPPGGSAPALEVVAYADANSDTIVLSITPSNAAVIATWQALKPTAQTLPGSTDCQSYEVTADVIAADGSLVYHRNSPAVEESYMVKTLLHTNVKGVVHGYGPDPMMNRTTGALVAKLPQNSSSTLAVTVLTANTDTAEAFVTTISAKSAAFAASARAFPPVAHTAWWAGKWAQHSIEVGPSSNATRQTALDTLQISQKYVWQRFIELSQARSPFPIKFNGMLYGAKRPPHADLNLWGGLNWWQNLRMPYYNMLTSGDTDELKTLFASFNRTVPIARQRTRSQFGFEGIWWPEYTHVFYGTPHPGGRGLPFMGYRAMAGCTPQFAGEPDWHSDDEWNGYNRQGSLDLSLMILDHYAYTGEAISDFLAIPMGVVEFYANLWGNTSSARTNGKMVFFPTQAVETWQCPGWPVNDTDCPTNDMPTVSGLHSVIEKLLQLPPALATRAQVATWTKIKSALPPLPAIDGKHAPCDNCVLAKDGGHGPGCHRMSNGETAELYSVHPYRQATIARAKRGDGSEWAKANMAFNVDPQTRSDEGWNQVVMNAALLGNATVAAKYVIARARTPLAGGYRFPGFAPRMQDAAPSADHYAVFSTALQYMLIQRADDVEESVLLLPAWPCDWNVNFTVTAPKQTVITGAFTDGALHYTVTPTNRASAVRAGSCQSVPAQPPPPPTPPPSPSPPPAPPGTHCNMTAWRLLCKPAPTNVSACMQCCELHEAELWKLNCIGSDCWPDYCAGKPAPGCHSPSPSPLPSPSPPAYYKLKPESFAGVLGSDFDWAVRNIPLFESANRTLDNVYYFRWRTYKSHIHATGIDAFPWVVTEFSPNVSWGGAFDTINGDAGAHIAEAGWLRGSDGRAVLDSILRWWVEAGLHPGWMPAPGTRKTYIKYYYWYAVALKRNYDKTANKTLLQTVLPGYKTQFMQFATGAAPGDQQMVIPFDQQGSKCLYNVPGNDAQEAAISGPGCRPLVQSTMYGEAAALAEMFAAIGDQSSAAEMAAEADKWQHRVLQQWNADLTSFDTIHPAVAPMPPGWNEVPLPTKHICNATLLFQGFELRGGCTDRCIANADCHFMTFNDANDWCQLTQYCNTTLPLNGLGFPHTWGKPPASDDSDAGVTSHFEPFKTGVFCCDQSPCVKGESTFLFQGAASRAECEAKCLANARCSFITSTGLSPTDWCMNAEYCNSTNPFGGKQGNPAAVTLQRTPTTQGSWSFAGVRELASLTSPWLFSVVPRSNASAYAHSWDTAFDPEGLGGPNGLRTAEKRHPDYFCDAGCCSWAGPVWPYETSKGISAAINVLNRYPEVTTLDSAKFWSMLGDYTTMHTTKWKVMSSPSTFYSNLSSSPVVKYLMDGLGELWVAENGCGDEHWTRQTNLGGPAWTDTATNGYRYNHATFMDLVLSGVVGIQPEPNGTLVVNPLVSPRSLAWWAADGISLHGKIVSVVFDADGTHYNAGAGLKVMVNGATAATSPTLRPLTVQL